jgi:hypothetical protein
MYSDDNELSFVVIGEEMIVLSFEGGKRLLVRTKVNFGYFVKKKKIAVSIFFRNNNNINVDNLLIYKYDI